MGSKQLSNVNYEQRDNFQMEIAAVEQANRREQDDFENQVKHLDAPFGVIFLLANCIQTNRGWLGNDIERISGRMKRDQSSLMIRGTKSRGGQ